METKFKIELDIFGNQPPTIDVYKLDVVEVNNQDYNVKFVEALKYSKGYFTTNLNNYKYQNHHRLIPMYYFEQNISNFFINTDGHVIINVFVNNIDDIYTLKQILNLAVKREIINYTNYITSKMNQYEDILGVI